MHVQEIGVIRAFCLSVRDLLSFSVPGGTEKIADKKINLAKTMLFNQFISLQIEQEISEV